MSEKINNGGPAFPESYIGADAPHEGIGNGMTLRDYFAALAMQESIVVLTKCGDEQAARLAKKLGVDVEDFIYPMAAQMAYNFADAMLKARS
jgi:hypothetical protein